jgi:hypothetical protein
MYIIHFLLFKIVTHLWMSHRSDSKWRTIVILKILCCLGIHFSSRFNFLIPESRLSHPWHSTQFSLSPNSSTGSIRISALYSYLMVTTSLQNIHTHLTHSTLFIDCTNRAQWPLSVIVGSNVIHACLFRTHPLELPWETSLDPKKAWTIDTPFLSFPTCWLNTVPSLDFWSPLISPLFSHGSMSNNLLLIICLLWPTHLD